MTRELGQHEYGDRVEALHSCPECFDLPSLFCEICHGTRLISGDRLEHWQAIQDIKIGGDRGSAPLGQLMCALAVVAVVASVFAASAGAPFGDVLTMWIVALVVGPIGIGMASKDHGGAP